MDNQKRCCTCMRTFYLEDITSITFNGLRFVCLDPCNSRIILVDESFNTLETICAQHKYTSICFDSIERCYWAISDNNASVIYQIDSCFNEINKIYIKNIRRFKATGISYNCCEKKIWIAFPSYTGYLEKGCDNLVYIQNRQETMINKAILSLPLCEVVSYQEDCKQFIEVCVPEGYKDFNRGIPKGYTVEDICLVSCMNNKIEQFTSYKICLLLSENCSHKRGILMCDLQFYENQAPKFSCENFEEMNSECNCSNCCEQQNCRDDSLYFKKRYYKAKYEVIHSIALEEAAIAHILNAEGEKIQKAVALCDNIDKLLCVNDSVKQTIIHITQLESQLYLKLESIQKNDVCDCCEMYDECMKDLNEYM
ncbi:MAG: hypothetical protein RR090_06245 [Niameybacter sp.]|uniref:hypothetical protein n=1 Tax=Niameybacter sp. TaxID=2033640 RepID=UPI002FCA4F27